MNKVTVDDLIAAARTEVVADPRAIDRVEAAIRQEHDSQQAVSRRRYHRSWMWVFPLAAAAAVAVTMLAPARVANQIPGVAPQYAAPTARERSITFVLRRPGARAVSLVGAFNDWSSERTRMTTNDGDTWTVVVPLAPGSYTYAFVVDGREWVPDPAAVRATEEDFGRPSSVVLVERGNEAI
jgi:hypothetical protein